MDEDQRRAATVADLIAAALAPPPDDDAFWSAVMQLQARGDQDTYEAARALCRDPRADRRELGVDILAQFGYRHSEQPSERPSWETTVGALLDLLTDEHDPRVLASIGFAFGHLHAARAIGPLGRLRDHLDPRVRLGAVHGVSGLDQAAAIDLLIQLSADPDDQVWDWATFGLAQQTEVDLPGLRQTLLARLDDSSDEVRGEAVVGLALRGDPRITEPMLDTLDNPWPCTAFGRLDEALCTLATATADPRLRRHVEGYRQDWTAEHPDQPPPEEIRIALEHDDRP